MLVEPTHKRWCDVCSPSPVPKTHTTCFIHPWPPDFIPSLLSLSFSLYSFGALVAFVSLSTLRNRPSASQCQAIRGLPKCIAPQISCKNKGISTKFHLPLAYALAKPRIPLLVSPQNRIRCAVCSKSPCIHGARVCHLNRHGASDFWCCGIGTSPPGLHIAVIFFQSHKLGEFLDKFRTSVRCD